MASESKIDLSKEKNTQVILAKRPSGSVKEDDVKYVTSEIKLPGKDEIVVKIEYVSMDPTHRIWMTDAEGYMPPVAIGEVMRAFAAGVVVASQNDQFKIGDKVSGVFGVQTYATTNPAHVYATKCHPSWDLTQSLDVFGLNGLTAMVGLIDVGEPKQGDTVLVSGAAGAVGVVVVQVAKLLGCNVVGIAGGKEKCDWLRKECGVEAVDYKACNTPQLLKAEIQRLCPKGVDVFFDNVGGDILNTALTCLAMYARVVFCGSISQYNTENNYGPSNFKYLLWKRAKVEGFIYADPQFLPNFPKYLGQLSGWLSEGKLKIKPPHVENGIENYVKTLNHLFDGTNSGKLLLKV